ncbi:toxin-antitoxin system HicB family antitoxin [Corynebacterium sp. 22KM0430]|uniref:toxin-antitoxin system HicB family antitoxin n=1 Tax=unclassified Corynebacterium TaxID=2624378 RepID=UPI0039B09FD0
MLQRPPEPTGQRSYSGKFQVRTSRLVHRNLVMEAASEGISLNVLVNKKLMRSWRAV